MKKFTGILIISAILISCAEKKPGNVKKTLSAERKAQILKKSQANFEELEREAEKKPEELTLPETKEEAIMPTVKKKTTVKKQPEIVKKEKPKKVERKIKTKYPMKNGLPVWVYNPNYGGYLGAVGIAKKPQRGGYPQQKRIAIMIAQSNLAKQIRLLVNAEIYTEKLRISKKDYEIYKSKLKSLSKQEASAYLRNTVVKDEWIDPKTGDLYVWVVLEK
ncbi:LPP20 family lipoprotein [Hydrogenivirga sp. 128-5-R1-1]|uniref:LPP20 family lipoprotein n=1 Tax=Hydrogenivirga sp. 128-5-R1-1 TaxID=392423 RepID=UPI00015F287D|nr:LPP20 family lipoprotein [Hydrogenivirga sp. 128-5-R1-1]EDP73807.1 hypothetical protein HG1285_10597 [Hydrogenivirga sp. 128-5-R1-1]